MIIGLPKEIKDHEYRVGATPAGVQALADAGHPVLVERGADLICKVKEPLGPEIARL